MAALAEPTETIPYIEESKDTVFKDIDEENQWVVPLELDCFGRPLTTVTFTVIIKRLLSPRSFYSLLSQFRRREW